MMKKIPGGLKSLKHHKNTCSKSRGVFFEVAEAPQAARTRTHRAGRPLDGIWTKFMTFGLHLDEMLTKFGQVWTICFSEKWTDIQHIVDDKSITFEGFIKYQLFHIPHIHISMDFLLIRINNCELNDGWGPHENSPKMASTWSHVAPPCLRASPQAELQRRRAQYMTV